MAAQAGLDYNLDEHWMLNMSVWWMNIETKTRFNDANGGHHSFDTRLDPWVFMFGRVTASDEGRKQGGVAPPCVGII